MFITGGSATNRATRNRAPRISLEERKIRASVRVVSKLGQDRVDTLRERWGTLVVSRHGPGGDGDIKGKNMFQKFKTKV